MVPLCLLVPSRWPVLFQAFLAINWFPRSWFEWYFTWFATIAANCLMHFSGSFKSASTSESRSFSLKSLARTSMLWKAFTTVHRSVLSRLKGHFTFVTTVSTNSLIHPSRSAKPSSFSLHFHYRLFYFNIGVVSMQFNRQAIILLKVVLEIESHSSRIKLQNLSARYLQISCCLFR